MKKAQYRKYKEIYQVDLDIIKNRKEEIYLIKLMTKKYYMYWYLQKYNNQTILQYNNSFDF